MSRTDAHRLGDIVERVAAIRRAEAALLAAENRRDSEAVELAFDAILYDLVVIGEAVKGLTPALRESRSEVPWSEVAGIRDVLTHHYFRVSTEIVRASLDKPLEDLLLACTELLEQESIG